jgi:hypothetical protein
MKKLIRYYAFWYGCLGSLLSLAWYVAALDGRATIPNNVWIVEAVFAFHATAAIATFQRGAGPRAWLPMIPVTPARLKLARAVFSISLLNFICCLGVFIAGVGLGNQPLVERMVSLILTSFLLMNTVYIVIHWAFRPENLFSGSFIRAISDPLGMFSHRTDDQ